MADVILGGGILASMPWRVGQIKDGIQHIWAVSDSNYFPGVASALDNNSVPTQLGDHMSKTVCEVALNTMVHLRPIHDDCSGQRIKPFG